MINAASYLATPIQQSDAIAEGCFVSVCLSVTSLTISQEGLRLESSNLASNLILKHPGADFGSWYQWVAMGCIFCLSGYKQTKT